MTPALLGTLAVLALIDSTSFGTLLIPIWLMLAPGRLRPARVVVFLGTVAAFYAVVGLLLSAGVAAFVDDLDGFLESKTAFAVQLVLGVALFAYSFWMVRKSRPQQAGGGRLTRWRDQAMGVETADGAERGYRGLVTLALAAAGLEVATMLPYLGAIGILAKADLAVPMHVGALLLYCVVMILPALVLLVVRLGARQLIEPVLRRFGAWMERSSRETTSWIIGIVGFLLARDAVARLFG
ncbi:GAP family protein [Luteipulveratus mongoliensis]|uniref:GAP family protein n=1 Tax=Luteipulveratus mongoliensis TaxID=571913 RepID=UPI0012EEA76F|nr:GAP family protein [Luteipulveratus mongoliensis]